MAKKVDFLQMEELYSEEELMIRDSVFQFVEEEVLPTVDRHFRDATFPKELIKRLGELGLLGPTLKGYGAAGLGYVAYGLIMQELERGDTGVRSFASVQSSLCMFPIDAYGSPEQKQRYLPGMVKGEIIGCFGLTEPDFGSNPGGMITKAVKDGNGYVLNGAKMWITNGSMAHIAIVWAKLDGIVRGFLVPTDSPGFTAREIKGKYSLRASDTSELIFEDCRISGDGLLPGVTGLKGPLSCLSQARYGIAWGALGSAIACFNSSVDYSTTRIQFDKPIAAFQMVQAKLAWMLTEITKGQLLAYRVGRLKEAGKETHVQISMAKQNNVKIALEIARVARDIHGANGICDEYPIMRHMMNLESVYTYEGTNDIHVLVIGKEITGIDALTR